MKPGQSIEIQLMDRSGQQPVDLANVMIDVHLFYNGRFRYAFDAGRTSNAGTRIVTYDDLEGQRRRNGAMFLMDYNTKLDDCDTKIELRIRTRAELIEARKAVLEQFRREPDWASDWPANSEVKVDPVFVELQGQVTRVLVPCGLAP